MSTWGGENNAKLRYAYRYAVGVSQFRYTFVKENWIGYQASIGKTEPAIEVIRTDRWLVQVKVELAPGRFASLYDRPGHPPDH